MPIISRTKKMSTEQNTNVLTGEHQMMTMHSSNLISLRADTSDGWIKGLFGVPLFFVDPDLCSRILFIQSPVDVLLPNLPVVFIRDTLEQVEDQ